MFKAIAGGAKINIQGLNCQLPPVGHVVNSFTGELEMRPIILRSQKQEEQYWERKELPKWYIERDKEVEKIQKDKKNPNPDYFDPKCQDYEIIEWDRRLNGCWVMMNGMPVYLTGLHYMYLQWWKIDIGYPEYRQPDLEYFYFLQYVIEDPLCLGMLEITKRRFGKTYRAGLFAFEYTSRATEAQSGIQSKTGNDAKKFFSKAVVRPFKRLPRFFRPTYDVSSGITPKKEIRFQQTNVRGRDSESVMDKDELESLIDWESADDKAYDGQKIHRKVDDEWAKTTEVNIIDRHEVANFCLKDDKGKIIGKVLYTSTVEKLKTERDGISEAARQLWDESDQNDKKFGRTSSGLYRFFMPATRTRNFDKFGIPNEVLTLQQILEERAAKKSKRALGHLINKEPITIEEAFQSDTDKCIWNSDKLIEQETFLRANPDVVVRGNLIWKDGVRDTEVVFEENKSGRCWMPRAFRFPKEERNKVTKIGGIYYPQNDHRFGAGLDSYDHDQVEDDNKKSKGCALVKQKVNRYNPKDPFINAYVYFYWARPSTADILYEDMIKMCVFFGISVLAESNKPGVIKYFRRRGYGACLMHLEDYKEPGIPSTPENKVEAMDYVEAQIENYCEKNLFIQLVSDHLKFNPLKTQPHDPTMAALWCERACVEERFQDKGEAVPENVDEIFEDFEINY